VHIRQGKNLTVKSTMFPPQNIHNYIWTSPDGKTHNQIDHILTDRRRHSSALDVRSFRAADCDVDHCLVVAKIRERLAANKQRSHRFHTERFNLKNLHEVEYSESILLGSQTGLQLWKIWLLRLKVIVLGKQLESLFRFQPKIV
jgi:hypothetical protein